MALTPMMQQYHEMKAQAQDALLFFRMGDFYELFFDDAREVARLLNLTLTSREKGENAIPMAGFPYHALDGQLRKLLELGKRVAICEQVEDPRQAVGLVKREITRVVSPGTLLDDNLLDPRQANFLLAIGPKPSRGRAVGLAWLDLTSSRLCVATIEEADVVEELARLEPAEILAPEGRPIDADWLRQGRKIALTLRPAWIFSKDNALDLLRRHFQVATFDGFGIEESSPGLLAAGALLAYLIETQKTTLQHIGALTPYHRENVMVLDPVTRRSLELTRTLREGRREGTLLETIDQTVTAGGARRLADWLSQPLCDVEAIRYRQSAIDEWKSDPPGRDQLRELLKGTFDVERLTSRISTGRTNPRDLSALRETLRSLPAIKARLTGRRARFNADLEEALDLLPTLRDRLEATLVDDPPWQIRDGGIIRDGFHAELDELRQAASGGKQWIADFQRAEIERTGIPTLKVGFNKVFGFYVEIPSRHAAPEGYQRKQTIKNAERYVTPELKRYEEKVLGAEERSKTLEYELFALLREATAAHARELNRLAGALAQLDCALGLAEIAATRHYVRPTVDDGDELIIDAGRHPVLEANLAAGRFVPNDTRLGDADDGRFMLITGPNMAGKSTYIRQVALIAILAQIGGFVPAAAATVGVVDRVFTRVGASDELSRGQSTFMVEMTETANILNNATRKSLVILDEIGRGTSTYDGVSLAWAIAERLHDKIGCRTLFATHYHELIELEQTLEGLRNRNVAVREWKDEIIFLHQIVEGGADRSYGIHVARLAGIPNDVLKRAQVILDQLERDPFGERAPKPDRPKKHRRTYHQLSLFPTTSDHPILDALRLTDVEALDADQALALVRDWRRRLLEQD